MLKAGSHGVSDIQGSFLNMVVLGQDYVSGKEWNEFLDNLILVFMPLPLTGSWCDESLVFREPSGLKSLQD